MTWHMCLQILDLELFWFAFLNSKHQLSVDVSCSFSLILRLLDIPAWDGVDSVFIIVKNIL